MNVDEPARTTPNNPARLFVLWLDATDGTVATHDGIQWPDGRATLHHRHFGYTTTHPDPETACRLTFGEQGRIEWVTTETQRIQGLAEEYPVAIPTHLIDEALDQPAHGPTATEATVEPTP